MRDCGQPTEPPATRAAEAGIHRIALPAHFGPGGVNAWLIEDDPLTLVDVGANWGSSILVLEAALAERDYRIEDLERVVVTHQHPDHAGALETVLARSNAEFVAPRMLQSWFADYHDACRADIDFRLDLLVRHGMPATLRDVLDAVNRSGVAWGSAAVVNTPLDDGDRLEFADRTFEVLARPGHSPSDTVFYDGERAMAITGDHLMADIPSVPFLSRPLTEEPPRAIPRGLPNYLASVARTRELELDVALPGHGAAFRGHAGVVDRQLDAVRAYTGKLFRAVGDAATTAFDLAAIVDPRRIWTRTELTMSFVLGHLILLFDDDKVVLDEEQCGLLRFRRA